MIRRTITVSCDHCVLTTVTDLTATTNEQAKASATALGWECGAGCEHDVCPACVRDNQHYVRPSDPPASTLWHEKPPRHPIHTIAPNPSQETTA